MTIQVNTDKNLAGSEKLRAYLTGLISEELSRFSNQITRVEIHLSDLILALCWMMQRWG